MSDRLRVRRGPVSIPARQRGGVKGRGGPPRPASARRRRRAAGRAARRAARPPPPEGPAEGEQREERRAGAGAGRWSATAGTRPAGTRTASISANWALAASGPSTTAGPSAPMRSRQTPVISARYQEAATARWPSDTSASGTDQRCARPAKGPEPGSTAGKSMIPRASTASTSAAVTAGSRPSISRDHSRPPMKRADGTGSPKALTLISVSRAASSAIARPPIAMEITQVPVETTAKGGRRATRCGSSEALESWMPQWTGVAGSSPVAAATSGGHRPEDVGGAAERRQQRPPAHARRPATRSRRARGFQRSVWQPSEVALGRRARPRAGSVQYCGYIRMAAARAAASGKRRNCQKSCGAEVQAQPAAAASRSRRRAGAAASYVGRELVRAGDARSRAPAAPARRPRRPAPRSRRAWSPTIAADAVPRLQRAGPRRGRSATAPRCRRADRAARAAAGSACVSTSISARRRGVDQHRLGVGLADVEDEDGGGRGALASASSDPPQAVTAPRDNGQRGGVDQGQSDSLPAGWRHGRFDSSPRVGHTFRTWLWGGSTMLDVEGRRPAGQPLGRRARPPA